MSSGQSLAIRPAEKMKLILDRASVQEQFQRALGPEQASLFAVSVLEVYTTGSAELQACDPAKVVQQALKAATLRLPVSAQLGQAYIVPRQNSHKQGNEWVRAWEPQLQIGWRGWVQLAQRTNQYALINAGSVYAGERVEQDRLTGEIRIVGDPTSEEEAGYFAYFRLRNGFEKALYWTMAQVLAHRDRHVKGWDRKGSAWSTSFGEMARKTVLSKLLRQFGPVSIEMGHAMEQEEERGEEGLPAAPNGSVRMPSGPGWIDDLIGALAEWSRRTGQRLPEGYPDEIRDERLARQWIAFLSSDGIAEAEVAEVMPEEPEF